MASRRRIWPLALSSLAIGLLAGLTAHSVVAQRPPVNDPIVQETLLKRYGTRHALTTLTVPGAGRTTATVRVANAGWVPTNIVAVGLAAPPVAPGCDVVPARVVAVVCLPGLGALASADLAALSGADHALVFSIAGDAGVVCASADALRTGGTTLATFETAAWAASPGAPIAVGARLVSGEGYVGRGGVPATGLASLGLLRPNGVQSSAAPFVPPAGAVRLINLGAECARIDVRAGRFIASGPCQLPAPSAAAVAPGQAFDLEPAGNAPVVGVGAHGEVISSVAWAGSGGAAAYDGQPQSAGGSGTLAFPVAIAPLTNPHAELWITNQAPTATTQIALLMWDGNLAQQRIYNDPEPLCPGNTRRYDIAALAGTIAPTRGRGGTEGPPVLSLRVESLNAEVATAPPIAGVMIVGGEEGMEAYSGVQVPQEYALAGRYLRQLQGQAGGAANYAPTNAVPNVMFRYGEDQQTTFLAIQAMGVGGGAERAAVIDLYDTDGALVLGDVRVQLGTGPGVVVDVGKLRGRPAMDGAIRPGFIGMALVRGAQARGALGVVAFNRPQRTLGGAPPLDVADELTVLVAPPLVRGPDPNAPTPTTLPTRPTRAPTEPVSPTPGDDVTATPGGGEATATSALPTAPTTPNGTPAARIVLPWSQRP